MSQAVDLLDVIGDPQATVVVDPPGAGPGYSAGAPSAGWFDDHYYLTYRLRRPAEDHGGRGGASVVARSADGVALDTLAIVTSEQLGCASVERAALVRLDERRWRLYVSCALPDFASWRVEAIDADRLEDLVDGDRTVVLAGGDANGWKDPVVRRSGPNWQMWACRHPLDDGLDEADRMTSCYFTSADGLSWTLAGTALAPTDGTWDARGTRITSVVRSGTEWVALYDGRAGAAENFQERTGVASGADPTAFRALAGPTAPDHTIRYVSLAETPTGTRLYWEAARPDGAHDLRTAYVPRLESPSQS